MSPSPTGARLAGESTEEFLSELLEDVNTLVIEMSGQIAHGAQYIIKGNIVNYFFKQGEASRIELPGREGAMAFTRDPVDSARQAAFDALAKQLIRRSIQTKSGAGLLLSRFGDSLGKKLIEACAKRSEEIFAGWNRAQVDALDKNAKLVNSEKLFNRLAQNTYPYRTSALRTATRTNEVQIFSLAMACAIALSTLSPFTRMDFFMTIVIAVLSALLHGNYYIAKSSDMAGQGIYILPPLLSEKFAQWLTGRTRLPIMMIDVSQDRPAEQARIAVNEAIHRVTSGSRLATAVLYTDPGLEAAYADALKKLSRESLAAAGQKLIAQDKKINLVPLERQVSALDSSQDIAKALQQLKQLVVDPCLRNGQSDEADRVLFVAQNIFAHLLQGAKYSAGNAINPLLARKLESAERGTINRYFELLGSIKNFAILQFKNQAVLAGSNLQSLMSELKSAVASHQNLVAAELAKESYFKTPTQRKIYALIEKLSLAATSSALDSELLNEIASLQSVLAGEPSLSPGLGRIRNSLEEVSAIVQDLPESAPDLQERQELLKRDLLLEDTWRVHLELMLPETEEEEGTVTPVIVYGPANLSWDQILSAVRATHPMLKIDRDAEERLPNDDEVYRLSALPQKRALSTEEIRAVLKSRSADALLNVLNSGQLPDDFLSNPPILVEMGLEASELGGDYYSALILEISRRYLEQAKVSPEALDILALVDCMAHSNRYGLNKGEVSALALELFQTAQALDASAPSLAQEIAQAISNAEKSLDPKKGKKMIDALREVRERISAGSDDQEVSPRDLKALADFISSLDAVKSYSGPSLMRVAEALTKRALPGSSPLPPPVGREIPQDEIMDSLTRAISDSEQLKEYSKFIKDKNISFWIQEPSSGESSNVSGEWPAILRSARLVFQGVITNRDQAGKPTKDYFTLDADCGVRVEFQAQKDFSKNSLLVLALMEKAFYLDLLLTELKLEKLEFKKMAGPLAHSHFLEMLLWDDVYFRRNMFFDSADSEGQAVQAAYLFLSNLKASPKSDPAELSALIEARVLANRKRQAGRTGFTQSLRETSIGFSYIQLYKYLANWDQLKADIKRSIVGVLNRDQESGDPDANATRKRITILEAMKAVLPEGWSRLGESDFKERIMGGFECFHLQGQAQDADDASPAAGSRLADDRDAWWLVPASMPASYAVLSGLAMFGIYPEWGLPEITGTIFASAALVWGYLKVRGAFQSGKNTPESRPENGLIFEQIDNGNGLPLNPSLGASIPESQNPPMAALYREPELPALPVVKIPGPKGGTPRHGGARLSSSVVSSVSGGQLAHRNVSAGKPKPRHHPKDLVGWMDENMTQQGFSSGDFLVSKETLREGLVDYLITFMDKREPVVIRRARYPLLRKMTPLRNDSLRKRDLAYSPMLGRGDEGEAEAYHRAVGLLENWARISQGDGPVPPLAIMVPYWQSYRDEITRGINEYYGLVRYWFRMMDLEPLFSKAEFQSMVVAQLEKKTPDDESLSGDSVRSKKIIHNEILSSASSLIAQDRRIPDMRLTPVKKKKFTPIPTISNVIARFSGVVRTVLSSMIKSWNAGHPGESLIPDAAISLILTALQTPSTLVAELNRIHIDPKDFNQAVRAGIRGVFPLNRIFRSKPDGARLADDSSEESGGATLKYKYIVPLSVTLLCSVLALYGHPVFAAMAALMYWAGWMFLMPTSKPGHTDGPMAVKHSGELEFEEINPPAIYGESDPTKAIEVIFPKGAEPVKAPKFSNGGTPPHGGARLSGAADAETVKRFLSKEQAFFTPESEDEERRKALVGWIEKNRNADLQKILTSDDPEAIEQAQQKIIASLKETYREIQHPNFDPVDAFFNIQGGRQTTLASALSMSPESKVENLSVIDWFYVIQKIYENMLSNLSKLPTSLWSGLAREREEAARRRKRRALPGVSFNQSLESRGARMAGQKGAFGAFLRDILGTTKVQVVRIKALTSGSDQEAAYQVSYFKSGQRISQIFVHSLDESKPQLFLFEKNQGQHWTLMRYAPKEAEDRALFKVLIFEIQTRSVNSISRDEIDFFSNGPIEATLRGEIRGGTESVKGRFRLETVETRFQLLESIPHLLARWIKPEAGRAIQVIRLKRKALPKDTLAEYYIEDINSKETLSAKLVSEEAGRVLRVRDETGSKEYLPFYEREVPKVFQALVNTLDGLAKLNDSFYMTQRLMTPLWDDPSLRVKIIRMDTKETVYQITKEGQGPIQAVLSNDLKAPRMTIVAQFPDSAIVSVVLNPEISENEAALFEKLTTWLKDRATPPIEGELKESIFSLLKRVMPNSGESIEAARMDSMAGKGSYYRLTLPLQEGGKFSILLYYSDLLPGKVRVLVPVAGQTLMFSDPRYQSMSPEESNKVDQSVIEADLNEWTEEDLQAVKQLIQQLLKLKEQPSGLEFISAQRRAFENVTEYQVRILGKNKQTVTFRRNNHDGGLFLIRKSNIVALATRILTHTPDQPMRVNLNVSDENKLVGWLQDMEFLDQVRRRDFGMEALYQLFLTEGVQIRVLSQSTLTTSDQATRAQIYEAELTLGEFRKVVKLRFMDNGTQRLQCLEEDGLPRGDDPKFQFSSKHGHGDAIRAMLAKLVAPSETPQVPANDSPVTGARLAREGSEADSKGIGAFLTRRNFLRAAGAAGTIAVLVGLFDSLSQQGGQGKPSPKNFFPGDPQKQRELILRGIQVLLDSFVKFYEDEAHWENAKADKLILEQLQMVQTMDISQWVVTELRNGPGFVIDYSRVDLPGGAPSPAITTVVVNSPVLLPLLIAALQEGQIIKMRNQQTLLQLLSYLGKAAKEEPWKQFEEAMSDAVNSRGLPINHFWEHFPSGIQTGIAEEPMSDPASVVPSNGQGFKLSIDYPRFESLGPQGQKIWLAYLAGYMKYRVEHAWIGNEVIELQRRYGEDRDLEAAKQIIARQMNQRAAAYESALTAAQKSGAMSEDLLEIGRGLSTARPFLERLFSDLAWLLPRIRSVESSAPEKADRLLAALLIGIFLEDASQEKTSLRAAVDQWLDSAGLGWDPDQRRFVDAEGHEADVLIHRAFNFITEPDYNTAPTNPKEWLGPGTQASAGFDRQSFSVGARLAGHRSGDHGEGTMLNWYMAPVLVPLFYMGLALAGVYPQYGLPEFAGMTALAYATVWVFVKARQITTRLRTPVSAPLPNSGAKVSRWFFLKSAVAAAAVLTAQPAQAFLKELFRGGISKPRPEETELDVEFESPITEKEAGNLVRETLFILERIARERGASKSIKQFYGEASRFRVIPGVNSKHFFSIAAQPIAPGRWQARLVLNHRMLAPLMGPIFSPEEHSGGDELNRLREALIEIGEGMAGFENYAESMAQALSGSEWRWLRGIFDAHGFSLMPPSSRGPFFFIWSSLSMSGPSEDRYEISFDLDAYERLLVEKSPARDLILKELAGQLSAYQGQRDRRIAVAQTEMDLRRRLTEAEHELERREAELAVLKIEFRRSKKVGLVEIKTTELLVQELQNEIEQLRLERAKLLARFFVKHRIEAYEKLKYYMQRKGIDARRLEAMAKEEPSPKIQARLRRYLQLMPSSAEARDLTSYHERIHNDAFFNDFLETSPDLARLIMDELVKKNLATYGLRDGGARKVLKLNSRSAMSFLWEEADKDSKRKERSPKKDPSSETIGRLTDEDRAPGGISSDVSDVSLASLGIRRVLASSNGGRLAGEPGSDGAMEMRAELQTTKANLRQALGTFIGNRWTDGGLWGVTIICEGAAKKSFARGNRKVKNKLLNSVLRYTKIRNLDKDDLVTLKQVRDEVHIIIPEENQRPEPESVTTSSTIPEKPLRPYNFMEAFKRLLRESEIAVIQEESHTINYAGETLVQHAISEQKARIFSIRYKRSGNEDGLLRVFVLDGPTKLLGFLKPGAFDQDGKLPTLNAKQGLAGAVERLERLANSGNFSEIKQPPLSTEVGSRLAGEEIEPLMHILEKKFGADPNQGILSTRLILSKSGPLPHFFKQVAFKNITGETAYVLIRHFWGDSENESMQLSSCNKDGAAFGEKENIKKPSHPGLERDNFEALVGAYDALKGSLKQDNVIPLGRFRRSTESPAGPGSGAVVRVLEFPNKRVAEVNQGEPSQNQPEGLATKPSLIQRLWQMLLSDQVKVSRIASSRLSSHYVVTTENQSLGVLLFGGQTLNVMSLSDGGSTPRRGSAQEMRRVDDADSFDKLVSPLVRHIDSHEGTSGARLSGTSDDADEADGKTLRRFLRDVLGAPESGAIKVSFATYEFQNDDIAYQVECGTAEGWTKTAILIFPDTKSDDKTLNLYPDSTNAWRYFQYRTAGDAVGSKWLDAVKRQLHAEASLTGEKIELSEIFIPGLDEPSKHIVAAEEDLSMPRFMLVTPAAKPHTAEIIDLSRRKPLLARPKHHNSLGNVTYLASRRVFSRVIYSRFGITFTVVPGENGQIQIAARKDGGENQLFQFHNDKIVVRNEKGYFTIKRSFDASGVEVYNVLFTTPGQYAIPPPDGARMAEDSTPERKKASQIGRRGKRVKAQPAGVPGLMENHVRALIEAMLPYEGKLVDDRPFTVEKLEVRVQENGRQAKRGSFGVYHVGISSLSAEALIKTLYTITFTGDLPGTQYTQGDRLVIDSFVGDPDNHFMEITESSTAPKDQKEIRRDEDKWRFKKEPENFYLYRELLDSFCPKVEVQSQRFSEGSSRAPGSDGQSRTGADDSDPREKEHRSSSPLPQAQKSPVAAEKDQPRLASADLKDFILGDGTIQIITKGEDKKNVKVQKKISDFDIRVESRIPGKTEYSLRYNFWKDGKVSSSRIIVFNEKDQSLEMFFPRGGGRDKKYSKWYKNKKSEDPLFEAALQKLNGPTPLEKSPVTASSEVSPSNSSGARMANGDDIQAESYIRRSGAKARRAERLQQREERRERKSSIVERQQGKPGDLGRGGRPVFSDGYQKPQLGYIQPIVRDIMEGWGWDALGLAMIGQPYAFDPEFDAYEGKEYRESGLKYRVPRPRKGKFGNARRRNIAARKKRGGAQLRKFGRGVVKAARSEIAVQDLWMAVSLDLRSPTILRFSRSEANSDQVEVYVGTALLEEVAVKETQEDPAVSISQADLIQLLKTYEEKYTREIPQDSQDTPIEAWVHLDSFKDSLSADVQESILTAELSKIASRSRQYKTVHLVGSREASDMARNVIKQLGSEKEGLFTFEAKVRDRFVSQVNLVTKSYYLANQEKIKELFQAVGGSPAITPRYLVMDDIENDSTNRTMDIVAFGPVLSLAEMIGSLEVLSKEDAQFQEVYQRYLDITGFDGQEGRPFMSEEDFLGLIQGAPGAVSQFSMPPALKAVRWDLAVRVMAMGARMALQSA